MLVVLLRLLYQDKVPDTHSSLSDNLYMQVFAELLDLVQYCQISHNAHPCGTKMGFASLSV